MKKVQLAKALRLRMQLAVSSLILLFGALSVVAGYIISGDSFNKTVERENTEIQLVLSTVYWELDYKMADSFIQSLLESGIVGYVKIEDINDPGVWIEAGTPLADRQLFKKALLPLNYRQDVLGYVTVEYTKDVIQFIVSSVIWLTLIQCLLFSILIWLIFRYLFNSYFTKPASSIANFSHRLVNILYRPENQLTDTKNRKKFKYALQTVINTANVDNLNIHEWAQIIDTEKSLVAALIEAIDEFDSFISQLENMNEVLTSRVKSRNHELVKRGEEIADVMDKLKMSQSLIVHQEKMASVGQLAAGIAHEINNPNGFIIANLNSMKTYFKDIKPLINSTKEEDKKELAFILDDGMELLDDCLDGTQRIKEIVSSLKGYARGEHATDLHKFDPVKAIKDAIRITQNEVKYIANLKFQVLEHSFIFGTEGKLTQVMANLIINASHAIADLKSKDKHQILITLTDVEECVEISVTDDGPGMTEKTKQKAFEPFFTTKAVGKGTGLGLHIVFDIIENQFNGKLLLEDADPQGLTVRVRLPMA